MAVDSILYSHLGNRSYLLEPLTFSPGQDKRYTRNKQLWRDVISEKLRAYTTVTLKDFLVFEWFPRSPGLFYTRGAKNARAEALGNIAPHFTLRPHMENVDNDPVSGVKNLNSGSHRVVFTPLGKSSMLQGGVGCIRLKPIQKDQTVLWLMSASSSYIAHEGFPLAVPNMLYQENIAEILDTGAIRRTIVGELKFVPNPFSQLYEYYPDVPSMYLEVSEIRPARMASRNNDQQPEVSVAVSFVSNFEHRADVYASYVSFKPGVKQSFEEAVYWLKSVYIENLYKGRIITDFDQTKTHFPEAALSLRKVMGRHLGRGELEEAIGLLQVRGDVNRIYENLEIGELAHAAARVARTKSIH